MAIGALWQEALGFAAVLCPEAEAIDIRNAKGLQPSACLHCERMILCSRPTDDSVDWHYDRQRLERMDQGLKRGKKPDEAEKKLLLKCKEGLENEDPLRDMEFSEEEERAMRHLQFMSIKPQVIVLNVAESDIASERTAKTISELEGMFKGKQVKILSLCGKIEMEIAQLSPEEAKVFLDDLGISEPALNKLIRVSYDLLGLISFLTAGEDEVRAWTIHRGLNAQKAAGKIHSDIERGFIRAELVSYDDFIACGGMAGAREKGLLRLEGKTYEVKDGDIINFRFNV